MIRIVTDSAADLTAAELSPLQMAPPSLMTAR